MNATNPFTAPDGKALKQGLRRTWRPAADLTVAALAALAKGR